MNHRPALPRSLVGTGTLTERFTVIDVGASGGIPGVWFQFGSRLVAYAFDPLVAEVERLNKTKPPLGSVEYIDAFVVRSSSEPDEQLHTGYETVGRSSTIRSLRLTKTDQHKDLYNAGAEVVYTSNRYSIDEFTSRRGIESVDFIKTDTDGYDYSVLLGAEETLRRRRVLGVIAEVDFNGSNHPHVNLFANNDLYLRSLGFKLFDLDIRRYTRAALPGKFRHNMQAQTVRGQPAQADALWLRDFVDPGFQKTWTTEPSAQQLLKMVLLFEIFGLNDCAIELIDAFSESLSPIVDIELLRSVLTEEASGVSDYGQYMSSFEEYVRAGRFAAFPDDYVIATEGYLSTREGDPKTAVFRPR